MKKDPKRWYELALEQVRTLIDGLPADDATLRETLKTRSTAILNPLNRIDSLMKLIQAANHDIPLAERPATMARCRVISADLQRFAARAKRIGHEIN